MHFKLVNNAILITLPTQEATNRQRLNNNELMKRHDGNEILIVTCHLAKHTTTLGTRVRRDTSFGRQPIRARNMYGTRRRLNPSYVRKLNF